MFILSYIFYIPFYIDNMRFIMFFNEFINYLFLKYNFILSYLDRYIIFLTI